jgi:hypothetical protein
MHVNDISIEPAPPWASGAGATHRSLMPPRFHSKSAAMSSDFGDRRVLRWALSASLAVHALVTALLIFGLPVSPQQAEKEDAISVELVPPPKPPEKPKPKPQSAPAPQKPAAEKPRSANEAKTGKPAPKSDDAVEPLPVLKKVFHFGEKDAGARQSPNGTGASDKQSDGQSDTPSGSAGHQEPATGERPDATQNGTRDGSASPGTPSQPDKQESAVPPALTTTEGPSQLPQPAAPPKADTAEAAPSKPVEPATAEPKLEEAKTLFSQAATQTPAATTAMGKLPRDERAGHLCVTELQEQLRHAWPPVFPQLLPNYLLKRGTVLEVHRAAFLANRQWFELSFRCEVDADAMKVVSFALHVGDPIPKSEWAGRGLPSR